MTLEVTTAVFIGGTSLFGGLGTITHPALPPASPQHQRQAPRTGRAPVRRYRQCRRPL
jgi:hypothetical protein